MSWINEGTHDIGDTLSGTDDSVEFGMVGSFLYKPYCWTHEVRVEAENAAEHGVRFVDDGRTNEWTEADQSPQPSLP